MRLFLLVLLLFTACGKPRGIPIQINLDTPEEHAIADPWIAELNRLAGCEWVFGPGKVWFDNRIEMRLSTKDVEKVREVDEGHDLVGYWDGVNIVMMDKEQVKGRALDTEALIFLHELGHAVGFDHAPYETSWMYEYVSPVLDPHDAAWHFVQALGGRHGTWTVCDQVKAAQGRLVDQR